MDVALSKAFRSISLVAVSVGELTNRSDFGTILSMACDPLGSEHRYGKDALGGWEGATVPDIIGRIFLKKKDVLVLILSSSYLDYEVGPEARNKL